MSANRNPESGSIRNPFASERAVEWRLVTSNSLPITAMIVAAVGLTAYLVLGLGWQQQPFVGAIFTQDMVVEDIAPFSDEIWPALAAGLQPGDELIGMNGQDWPAEERLARYKETLSELNVGDGAQLTVFVNESASTRDRMGCVDTADDSATCTVSITLREMPTADFAVHFGVSIVMGLVVLVLGALIWWQRPDTRTSRLLAASTAALSLVLAGRFDLITGYELVPIWIGANFIFAGILLSLSMSFPSDLPMVRRVPALRQAPLLAAVILLVASIGLVGTSGFGIVLPLAIMLLAVVGSVAMMYWRREFTASPIIREQATFLGIGIVAAFTPTALWALYFLVTGSDTPDALTPVSQIAVVLYVFSLGYSVLQYRLLETDRIIPEFVVYAILTMILLMGYVALVAGLSLLTVDAITADNPILIALTLAIIVLLFNPVRYRLRGQIDRVMFRRRINYEQRTQAFSRELSDAVNLDGILSAVQNELTETLSPVENFVFMLDARSGGYVALPKVGERRAGTDVVFPPDGGLVTYLKTEQSVLYLESGEPLPVTVVSDRSRLAALNMPLLLRLQVRDRLHGVLALGPRRNGDNYSYEALRYLEDVADQVAAAIERARFVDELETRVEIQDVLAQISRALNFALDLNTLLELIFAQTSRIIEADRFMIALYSPNNDEIYFAFFATSDERLDAIESVRWRVGNDPISRVLRTQKPTRLENFSEEAARHSNYTLETPLTYAWMGIPLTTDSDSRSAGSSGVMAVGASAPSMTFTDEQLEVFTDLVNVAAGAIDKTELLYKTQTRARQLKALNDISSQLAEELEDVDRLLDTITNNAVNILGCEAGSLLLVDERTGDLIFQVATGGSGTGLIGQRIASDESSLVANAIKSMSPIIVNDPLHDERWHGDMETEDGFRSENILTVPLLAQGAAVGALQVINKRDKSYFTDEDATLATTFAGQAAIAIQNARLFQTQDQALMERVDELERMSDLDRSLNQTLYLNELMDILLAAGLQQTGGHHAALFLMNEENMLELRASKGYPADSRFSESAIGMMFVPSEGVLGRAINSRSPALVSDVENDPAYMQNVVGSQGQLAAPFGQRGEGNGVILIETDQANSLSIIEMNALGRLAERASSAIANALLYTKLEQQQEARAAFVSDIAHDIKNPITAMKGYTSMLVRGMVGEMNPQQSSFVGIVHRNIDHLENLVQDLQDMQIIDAKGKLELYPRSVSFPQLLEESLETVQQAFEERNQEVVQDVADDLPDVWVDPTRFKRVLINFLTNANKYTEDDGQVEISAVVMPNEWDESGDGPKRVLYVSVRDNGLGISEEDQEKLFQRYFRSTNDKALEQKGTGLGLALTRQLILQHGGTIWFESTLNVGTTFHFTIPLAEDMMTTRA